jgi:hypothetical protein
MCVCLCVACRSRYAHAFDGAYLSQFQVGAINETAAQQATLEAKQQQAANDSSAAASAPAPTATVASSSSVPAASFPLNRLVRPGGHVSVECVKFLPLSVDVKRAYNRRVQELSASAGWHAADPPSSAWSTPQVAHSWTDRTVEQAAEEDDKTQATTLPTQLHFVTNSPPQVTRA